MDLFHLLGSGAKFDKSRFKHDVKIFEGEREAIQTQSKKRNAAAMDSTVRSQLLDEIDFFKTTHTVIDTKNKSKKTNEQDSDSSNENDSSDDNHNKKNKSKKGIFKAKDLTIWTHFYFDY